MRQTFLRKAPLIRGRLLLGMIFLVPLLFMRHTYDAISLPKLWLVMVGVTVVGAIRLVELLQDADRSGLKLLVVPATAIIVPLVIGTLFSPYRVWALVGDHGRYTGLLPYVFLVLLGILVADRFRGDTQPVAWALLAAGGVAGAYAVVQMLGLDPFEWSYRGSESDLIASTLGNPNFAGAFFAMVLPLGTALFFVAKEHRAVLAPLVVLVAIGWIVTRSEAAWGAGIAGFAVMGGILLSDRWRPAKIAGVVVAAAVALVGVSLVTLSIVDDQSELVPRSLERRGEWWEASSRLFMRSPFVGRGPNSFAIDHTQERTLRDVVEAELNVTDDPHSVPLNLAVAAGIFGLVGFAVFAGWLVRRVIAVPAVNLLAAGFAGGAVAYLVQSLVSIDTVSTRAVAWTLIGSLAASTAAVRERAKWHDRKKGKAGKNRAAEPLKRLPAVVGVVLVATVSFVWSVGLLRADSAFQRGWNLGAVGARGSQEAFRSAVAFRSNDTYRREYGRLLGANAVKQAEAGDQSAGQALLQEAQDNLSFVDDLPHMGSVLIYARVMRDWAQQTGSGEAAALELYRQATEVDPRNFLIYEEAAEAASSFGADDAGEAFAEQAAALRDSAQD